MSLVVYGNCTGFLCLILLMKLTCSFWKWNSCLHLQQQEEKLLKKNLQLKSSYHEYIHIIFVHKIMQMTGVSHAHFDFSFRSNLSVQLCALKIQILTMWNDRSSVYNLRSFTKATWKNDESKIWMVAEHVYIDEFGLWLSMYT